MRIGFVGAHPLMQNISDHLAKTHIITAPTWADIVIVGGYSNDLTEKFIYTFKKPTILLSSYLVYAGANHSSSITEETSVSIHPMSDLSTIALNYLYREKLLLDQGAAVLRIFPIAGTTTYLDTVCTWATHNVPYAKQRLGWRTRSFLAMEDFLAAIDSCIAHYSPGLYNLGSEEETTVQDLTQMVYQAAGRATLLPVEAPWTDLPWRPTKIVPNTERFRLTFNWEPKYTLKATIKHTLNLL